MSIPAPLIVGTIIYLILAAALLLGVFGCLVTRKLSKDDAAIANVVVVIAVFATWLFWACAWLHQWHPLIVPIYEE
eukprot:CAMPEP_0183307970 /NCGR_PEP_ID=MMETSP0160_2-20130417/19668_1 /TAXON_ID=2839 ORGANISM="Odontella Sinensis, Strain Grunow 1884" /NCGR_SAMPLE_ID=MMETSP0160_2 /ASSEMBLY_ACC=CAM_ASM_000250 /LENGTH=75 /DNA_ID=CAMNT_0025471703 /DNA_START=76 /DNA_END=303 /DNA_ORIENTATION=+